MIIDRDTVLAAFAGHIGASRGITARGLVTEICGEYSPGAERALRHVITDLRGDCYAICGEPKTGYYVAETQAELDAGLKFLRRRALTSLRLHNRLKRATPGLSGQRRLML